MVLQQLRLTNFRSYGEQAFDFSPDVTVITGRNGVGKTNILEAIYVLMQGRSFRDSDELLVQHEQDWWKIEGQFDSMSREVRYQPGKPSPKQLYIDTVSKGRFTYKQQLPVVLFEPDDLLLLHGSPSARRAYLDEILVWLVPTYRHALAKYERALLQRNNLLKKGGSLATLRDTVFVWDIALSEYGAALQQSRTWLIEKLQTHLSEDYSALATKIHTVSVVYEPAHQGTHALARALAASLEKDIIRGFTSVGPHRDDIAFILNGKDARTTASRGEIRTIVLSLKYAELRLLTEATASSPIFLLDDVFSELDETRQKNLLVHTEGTQKIITTTAANKLRGTQHSTIAL